MEIIKEIRLAGQRESFSWSRKDGESVTTINFGAVGIVRTNTYWKTLSYFNELVEAARKTFPFLTHDDFRVVHFGGDRYKGTMGLEFDIPGNISVAPEGWREVKELEKCL